MCGVACRVDTVVEVDVHDDGSGVVTVAVTLDRSAATELGEPAAVAVEDLEEVGWDVADPEEVDGGLRLVARRSFARPGDLPRVLEEVGGVGGVFREVALVVRDGPGRVSYRFDARVVLSGDPAQFADPELAAALGGLPLGRTPEELAFLGADDPATATLELAVRLPGPAPDTDGRVVDGRAVWRFPVTGGAPTDQAVRSSSRVVDRTATILLVAAVAVAVVALVVLVAGAVRRVRRSSGSGRGVGA